MKRIKTLAFVFAVLAGSTWAANENANAPAPLAQGVASATPDTVGEVRKIDAERSTVTLKHGPIVNLDMPGMTMVFKAADPKLLQDLRPGDKVRFSAANVNGALIVTAITRLQ